ncbi:MAG: DNA polymerase IV [Actinobacteria bacterium]|nr:DNA polymerase IV [Actinomycetota bacterium]
MGERPTSTKPLADSGSRAGLVPGAGAGINPRAAHRVIAHLDFDAFFAAVEENRDPSLRGKPVIVGGGERGVVSTANYVARRYGVHSAMPLRTARRLCPQGVYLTGHHQLYYEYSRRLMAILDQYSPLVEKMSLDEAYVDLTGTDALFGPPVRTARLIQRRVMDELDLSISVGVATNKLVAKVASDYRKPGGFTVISPGREAEFLAPLPVERLPGVGPVLLGQLRDRGVVTVGDLARVPADLLRLSFGEWGEVLAHRARGEDLQRVTPCEEVKSISREHTFEEDVSDVGLLESTLVLLTEDVCRRLRHRRLEARTVTVKIRYSDFVTHTCSHTLPKPQDVDEVFFEEVLGLFRHGRNRRYHLRLVGVGLSNLVPRAWQDDLFDQGLPLLRELDLKLDVIREKYGNGAVRRGAAFP